MRLCSVPGCGRPHRARGLCRLHYERERHDATARQRTARYRARRSADAYRQALRELCHRLIDLGVVEDEEQAVVLVAAITVNWPVVGELTGAGAMDWSDHGLLG